MPVLKCADANGHAEIPGAAAASPEEPTVPTPAVLPPPKTKAGENDGEERGRTVAMGLPHMHGGEAVVRVLETHVKLDAQHTLSAHNSNGPTASKLLAYFQARSSVLPIVMPWLDTDPRRRHNRWKRFVCEQRSFSQFCNRIRAMTMQQRGNGSNGQHNEPLVIAYGAKGLSNGLVVKGIPPCINTGPLYTQSEAEKKIEALDAELEAL